MIKKRKYYKVIDDSSIGSFSILKDTKVSSCGYVDEDGGIACAVESGEHKGKVIIFSIAELEEISL